MRNYFAFYFRSLKFFLMNLMSIGFYFILRIKEIHEYEKVKVKRAITARI